MGTLYPASFLWKAQQHGVILQRDGDYIRVRGTEDWRKTPSVVAYIKRNKAMLLECLNVAGLPTEEELDVLGAEADAAIEAREKAYFENLRSEEVSCR